MQIEGWIKDIIEKTILQDWVTVIYTNRDFPFTRDSFEGNLI